MRVPPPTGSDSRRRPSPGMSATDALIRRSAVRPNRSVSPVFSPAAVNSACACPRRWVWWLKKCRDQQPLRRRHLTIDGAAEPGQVTAQPVVVYPPIARFGVALRPGGAQFVVVLDHVAALLDRRLGPRPIVEARHPLTVATGPKGRSSLLVAPQQSGSDRCRRSIGMARIE